MFWKNTWGQKKKHNTEYFKRERKLEEYTRSTQKVSSHVIWKIETFIEEDTRYKKHCTKDKDASVPFKVGTLGPHTVLPIAISFLIVFSWISSTVWNLLSKVLLVLGKARSCRVPNLFLKNTLHKTWCMSGLLNHPNSFRGGMFKPNAKFDADSLLYSLRDFECNSHTVHMLSQWHLPPPLTSTVKSSLFTCVHSSPLSLAARLYWCHAKPFSLY